MHLQPVNDSIVGKTLGRNIIGAAGKPLLVAGTPLTDVYVQRLAALGIARVYLLDGEYDDAELSDAVSEASRSQALSVIADLASAVESPDSPGSRLTLAPVLSAVEAITRDVLASPVLVATCADLRSMDEYTYHHSVNTCVIALQLGRKACLPPERMRDLGLGAILHDMGKLHIPSEILNKNGPLTPEEFEVMKTHSALGWESLKRLSSLGAVPRSAAIQHHEKFDGTGYPKGMRNREICWVARYVAVADVFDALTSDRPYRGCVPNCEALADYMPLGSPAFDPDILALLHKVVCPYPPGTSVLLSDGTRGVVMRVTEAYINKPLVRRLDRGGEVDLAKERDLYVTQFLGGLREPKGATA